MHEITKSNINTKYEQYQHLLLEREELKKAIHQTAYDYMREFGEKVLELFELKIACIRLKKTINFCQMKLNQGLLIDASELSNYLAQEMKAFEEQFSDLIKQRKASLESEAISDRDMLEIKKIYKRIAKKIHPDLRPELAGKTELLDLWERVKVAYRCNKLKELRELEVLIQKAILDIDAGLSEGDIDIPNIEDKIDALKSEIEQIRSSHEFQLRFILNDPEATRDRHEELASEIKSYSVYKKELEEMVALMLPPSATKLS